MGALPLVPALGHVDVKPRVARLGHLPAGADHRGRGAVRAVGRRLYGDHRIPRVLGDQLAHPARRRPGVLAVARGCALPVVHRARQDQPDARVPRRLDHGLGIGIALIVEVEEVHAGRDAVDQHLGEGEGGAEVDALAVEARRVRIEHALAPRHEVEVVTESAQERLEGMAMGVDGAGKQRPAGQADDAGPSGLGAGRRRRDPGDPPVGDIHHARALEAPIDENEIGNQSGQRHALSQLLTRSRSFRARRARILEDLVGQALDLGPIQPGRPGPQHRGADRAAADPQALGHRPVALPEAPLLSQNLSDLAHG